MPSPHDEVHAAPTAQLGSLLHAGVQPSPQSLLPSSHASVPSRPFWPHTVAPAARRSVRSSRADRIVFDPAAGVAAVAVVGVVVVALLVAARQPVAAHRAACVTRARARVATLDVIATSRAAVAVDLVAVVAHLVAADDSVAALDEVRTRALRSGRARTHPIGFGAALSRTAVGGRRVAVVALLGAFAPTVAAHEDPRAHLARARARVAVFEPAAGAAAVAVGRRCRRRTSRCRSRGCRHSGKSRMQRSPGVGQT